MSLDSPDFYRAVQPSRVQLRAGQTRDYFSVGGTLSSGSYTTITIGTAAADENWLIAFFSCSINKSSICRVRLSTSEFGGTYYFFDSYFDIRIPVSFPDSGMFPAGAGAVIKVEIYNYGPESGDIRFQMHSTRIKV